LSLLALRHSALKSVRKSANFVLLFDVGAVQRWNYFTASGSTKSSGRVFALNASGDLLADASSLIHSLSSSYLERFGLSRATTDDRAYRR
jgi:hypothetical protein